MSGYPGSGIITRDSIGMIIAQISDLHVQPPGEKAYGIVDTNRYLKAAVEQLNRLHPQPNIVVATGDLVDERTEAEYRMLKEMLAPLRSPLYFVMGNHDHHDEFEVELCRLADSRENLDWHPFYLRRGNAVFLHGDEEDRSVFRHPDQFPDLRVYVTEDDGERREHDDPAENRRRHRHRIAENAQQRLVAADHIGDDARDQHRAGHQRVDLRHIALKALVDGCRTVALYGLHP